MSLTFAEDVLNGLSSSPKHLSSKYFYDKKGDVIFQKIMKMPEYYLTDCEYEIFNTYKHDLLSHFQVGDQAFQLIEFGAGDGYKTKVLLEHFLQEQAEFKYSPIDISASVLSDLQSDLQIAYPELKVETLNNEYFKALDSISHSQELRKVILFLGSNIGNFGYDQAVEFLLQLKSKLTSHDLLMIGFDLKKDPEVIIDAYSDPHGITRDFNLNLLVRINRELGGNFDLNCFKHWAMYHPLTGETKSYLISKEEQEVEISALNKSFHFKAWEAIDMEISQKYDLEMIGSIADHAGLEIVKHYFDHRKYFVNTVFEKK
jgi:dimethylhistidine N-methyltransferase